MGAAIGGKPRLCSIDIPQQGEERRQAVEWREGGPAHGQAKATLSLMGEQEHGRRVKVTRP